MFAPSLPAALTKTTPWAPAARMASTSGFERRVQGPAGVDDPGPFLHGVADRGDRRVDLAAAIGRQDFQRQDRGIPGDPDDADPVVPRRRDRPRDVRSVAVVVLHVVRAGGEIPAVDVVDVAVAVVVHAIGRDLAGVGPDASGQLGMIQVDAGVEHGDDRGGAPRRDAPGFGGVDIHVPGVVEPPELADHRIVRDERRGDPTGTADRIRPPRARISAGATVADLGRAGLGRSARVPQAASRDDRRPSPSPLSRTRDSRTSRRSANRSRRGLRAMGVSSRCDQDGGFAARGPQRALRGAIGGRKGRWPRHLTNLTCPPMSPKSTRLDVWNNRLGTRTEIFRGEAPRRPSDRSRPMGPDLPGRLVSGHRRRGDPQACPAGRHAGSRGPRRAGGGSRGLTGHRSDGRGRRRAGARPAGWRVRVDPATSGPT